MASIKKTLLVFFYLFIMLLIPLFLDSLLRITVREKRYKHVFEIAKNDAIKNKKSLIVFKGVSNGTVYYYDETPHRESNFSGDFLQIINEIESDSCVVLVCYALEYINNLNEVITTLLNISGNNLYVINSEKNSMRVWWDYKMVNIFDKSYLLKEEWLIKNTVKIVDPTILQKNIQRLYSYLFNIIPYDFFENS